MLKLVRPKRATKELLRLDEIFVERYEKLRTWSLALTDNDVNLAEDLLHDAFVQFTLSGADAHLIENLDGYLHTVLRNTYLSQMRRATRSPMHPRTIVDYDSAEISLRAFDPRIAVRAQDELRAVCEYALLRRITSKAGSVLILRFFHGYYPSEIVSVLQTSNQAVSVWLKIARQEAKRYLEDPASLHFMQTSEAATQPQATSSIEFGHTPDELLSDLRRAILSASLDACHSERELEALYQGPAKIAVNTNVLAHTVGCLRCLERVNALTGLPPLSERYPLDTLGKHGPARKGPKDDGGGTGGGGAVDTDHMTSYRRRTRDVFEHRPSELCITVNGLFQVSQKVVGGHSEQTLNVQTDEELSFIEVISEQEMRLLVLNAQLPPDGPARQVQRVALSDGRTIEAVLDFNAAQPTLRVVYDDPHFKEAHAPSVEALDRSLSEYPPSPQTFENGLIKGAIHEEGLLATLASIWRRFARRSFWLRPAAVTGVFALILLAALVFIKTRGPVAALTTADLLRRSEVAEETLAARTDQVLHRTINLEERKPTGELLVRRRIEVWQSAQRGITARRLYDENGKLLAGDWRRSDGVQTLYHHGTQPKLQLAPEKGASPTFSFDNVWQLSPSAKEFSSLIGNAKDVHLEERPNSYVITFYASSAEGAAPSVVEKAVLTLNRADLHPIEQTLTIRQGDETRDYRFAETGFERKALSTVAPSVFEPEPELLSATTTNTRNPKPETARASPLTLSPLPVSASPELEVEVLHLLNQAGADMGEQVSVTRTPEGHLRVQGIVETDERKRELLQALEAVRNNSAVQVQISSVTEVLQRQSKTKTTPDSVTVEQSAGTADTFPAQSDLRRYFLSRGQSESEATASARTFANRFAAQSSRVLQHAWALKRLGERFSPDELRKLGPEARANWLAMVREHARAVQQPSAGMRRELQPVFFSGLPSEVSEPGIEIKDDADLIRATERLLGICTSNDKLISAAFTVSSASAGASAIKSPQLLRSLSSAEALAARISRAQ